MKKKTLHKILALGISSAAMCSLPVEAQAAPTSSKTQDQGGALNAQEKAFAQRLTEATKGLFQGMDHTARKLVIRLSEMKCGNNPCAQLGGCKTKDHACKGQNSCKNKGGCRLNPNEAVKVVSDKLKNNRGKLLG